MIIACYNVYNEGKHLPQSVASVYDHVGKIVFVDGRYEGFYEDKPVASTDGMLLWIKNQENDPDGKFQLVKAPKKPWKNQAKKRSAYLVGKEGDIYLYIDGHEIVTHWRPPALFLGEVGFARLDLPEEDPPKSVKAPRLFAHKPGIKYVTHSYLEHGNDTFYVNLGWDHQTLGNMKEFWERVPVESCMVTIKHIGLQKKGLQQRQDQVKEERGKIEVYDHRKGLDFKADSHKAIDRFTTKMYDSWVKYANAVGSPVPSYEECRRHVADYAVKFEQTQHARRHRHQDSYGKVKMMCEHCGAGPFGSATQLMMHRDKEHVQ